MFYERDSESGEFALLDRDDARSPQAVHPAQGACRRPLRKMQPVIIPSRDGLQLNGYLTMPRTDAAAARCRSCW